MSEIKQKYVPTYDQRREKSISQEFNRAQGKCYLDHAGATLYSEKQIQDVFEELQQNLYGNPHSRSTTSKLTSDCVDQVRYQILDHLHTNVEEYTVIFTSGATAALKLVAENFCFDGGKFMYLQDNHTSVLGMREHAPSSEALSYNNAFEIFSNKHVTLPVETTTNSLFVYPAQCNFSGFKYPLDWVNKIQDGILNTNEKSKWYCFLDAASYLSSNELDLSKNKPDFVCISFYKIFGYPTGLGALLVKNGSSEVLKKKYFGGGTVYMAMSSNNMVVRRENLSERFEDGTIPFLAILSLRHGFDTLRRLNLNMDLISKHTFSLAKYTYDQLKNLKHGNNKPVCILYHDNDFKSRDSQGGIVNFNLLRCDGSYIGFSEVMHISNLFGIQIRTGCFCNPGACQRHLGLTDDDLKYHFEKGHVCGDQYDLIDGKPTGSVRISFGFMSTLKDADELLNLITSCFLTKPILKSINGTKSITHNSKLHKNGIHDQSGRVIGKLEKIQLYPIKSCGPYVVNTSWELVSTGLKYDREWMIITSSKICLTQKNEPRMCLIRPIVDIENGELLLTSEGFSNISVPLCMDKSGNNPLGISCISKVCTDSITGWDCGDEVSEWLSEVLNYPGLRLIKQSSDAASRVSKKGEKQQLSLANKAQFLLINKESVLWLQNCIPKDDLIDTMDGLIDRFRPNLIVNLVGKFIENDFHLFTIGEIRFAFQGKCTRCQMICIDQHTGEKSVEPLRTISKEFQGKINFGVYLQQIEDGANTQLQVNAIITGK